MDCSPKSERKALKFVGYIPVVLCLALISWSYYAFVPSLCIPMLLENPIQAGLYLVIYHFLLIMFVWSYLQILLTHPGTPADCVVRGGGGGGEGGGGSTTSGLRNPIPYQENSQTTSVTGEASRLIHNVGNNDQNNSEDGLIRNRPAATEPNSEQPSPVIPVGSPSTSSNFMELDTRQQRILLPMENVDVSVTVKRNGDQRFCTKCNFEKYDRAHHCRICKQCILKMDHHCPWINGCVGFRNQKFFLLFISWGALYCTFLAIATVPAFIHALQSEEGILTLDIHWAFLILAGGLFGLCLLVFATFHGSMVLSNRTTIESFQRHNYRSQGGLAPARHLNLFDVGKKKNFVQVMGEPWYLWFVPIGNSLGDGYTFPLNNESYSALAVGFGDRRIDRPSPYR